MTHNNVNRYKKIREEEKKDHTYLWRMTKTETEEFEMLSYVLDEPKSEILRKAFRMYVNANKGRF